MSKDIDIKVNVDTSGAESSVNSLDGSLNKLGYVIIFYHLIGIN